MTSFEILKKGSFEIELFETSVHAKEELENGNIEAVNCVNKRVPNRLREEYIAANRDKLLASKKAYYRANKTKATQKSKE